MEKFNLNKDTIFEIIKEWTITKRAPEVKSEMVRRYYYRSIIEKSEELKKLEIDKCRSDPIHWFNHWVWTFDPRGMPFGLPANLPFVLRPRQVDLVNYLLDKEEKQTGGVIEKSRDEGMSYVVLGFFLHHWLFVEGFTAGVGSRKEELVDKKGDPKTLFHKFRDMLSKLPDWMKPDGYNPREHDNYMRIVNPSNGATITGEAGDNIGRGGRTSMYLLDEWAFVSNPESIDAAISQNTNVVIKGSTPNGIGNKFYQDRFSGKYEIFTMPWRDNPDKNWAYNLNGRVIYPWYEKQKLTLDDVVIAQEVDIDYAASVDGVLIPSAWIQAAIDAHIKLGIEITGNKSGALDVADEGKDDNAFAGRRGILLEHISSWSGKGSDIYATSERACNLCDELGYKEFKYDADGLGSGVRGDVRVINEHRKQSNIKTINVIPYRGSNGVYEPDEEMVENVKNKDLFLNLKSQMWWSLRLKFQKTYRAVVEGMEFDKDDIISISSKLPELNNLTVELSQPTYSKNTIGKILINKKPDGAKSPNLADCVVIAYSKINDEMDIWTRLASG